jgi:hypothetical protein
MADTEWDRGMDITAAGRQPDSYHRADPAVAKSDLIGSSKLNSLQRAFQGAWP